VGGGEKSMNSKGSKSDMERVVVDSCCCSTTEELGKLTEGGKRSQLWIEAGMGV